jgi:hypothetical protein
MGLQPHRDRLADRASETTPIVHPLGFLWHCRASVEESFSSQDAVNQKLGVARKEPMSLGRELIMSQDLSLAAEADELVGEAEDAIRASQQ